MLARQERQCGEQKEQKKKLFKSLEIDYALDSSEKILKNHAKEFGFHFSIIGNYGSVLIQEMT